MAKAKYVIYDDNVAPRQLVPFLKELKAKSGCTYNSIYRAADAEALLHKIGKQSQTELYDGYRLGMPGYNPANKPGQSTHELCSDGVPYAGPVGRKLVWWQCGIDVNDADIPHVLAAAKSLGWAMEQPYPSGSEYHHVNLKAEPVIPIKGLPLQRGKHNNPLRLTQLRTRLRKLGWAPDGTKRKLTVAGPFNKNVQNVVTRYQKLHGLTADGIVGIQTWNDIKARSFAKK